MAWSHIQSVESTTSNGTATATLTSVSVGDLIMVAVGLGFSYAETSITDSLGNTYTSVAHKAGASGSAVYVYMTVSAFSGSSVVVTFKFQFGSFGTLELDQYRVSGTITAGTAALNTGSTMAATTGSLTVTGTALSYGAFSLGSAGGTVTPGSGFTTRCAVDFSAGVHFGLTVIDQLNDTTNPDNPSVSYATAPQWASGGVVLKATAVSLIVPIYLLRAPWNSLMADTP